MNSRDVFYHFILSEEASEEEFKKACKYLTDARICDRYDFYEKINAIIKQALIDTVEANASLKKIFKSVYQRYGITKDYFETFFTLYFLLEIRFFFAYYL